MHHLTCGISSLLHSVNLILFTLLLVHLILCISPHHSHHLRSHHLSLPRPFTPDLKLISFTNPFLHSLLIFCGLPSQILNLYWTKWALAYFVIVSCARLSWSHSAFESTLNSPISYRIVLTKQSLRVAVTERFQTFNTEYPSPIRLEGGIPAVNVSHFCASLDFYFLRFC